MIAGVLPCRILHAVPFVFVDTSAFHKYFVAKYNVMIMLREPSLGEVVACIPHQTRRLAGGNGVGKEGHGNPFSCGGRTRAWQKRRLPLTHLECWPDSVVIDRMT